MNGEKLWKILGPKSATLNVCRDLDRDILLLEELCTDIAGWRAQVLIEKHLPLHHFARLSALMSKLYRSKINLTSNVNQLVKQIRSMITGADTSNPLALESEMELVRKDKLPFLEEKLEKLNIEKSNAENSNKLRQASLIWNLFVLQILNVIEDCRANQTRKQILEFVSSLKSDRKATADRISQLSSKTEMRKLWKGEFTSLENQQREVCKREETLLLTKQKSKKEVLEWQQQKEIELKLLAQEREGLQVQQEHLQNQVLALKLETQKFEESRKKSERQLQIAAQDIEEKERLINARFPELSEIESYVTSLLQKLELTAVKVLESSQDTDKMKEIKETAIQSISFVEQQLKSFCTPSNGLRDMQKHNNILESEGQVQSVLKDSCVQCDLGETNHTRTCNKETVTLGGLGVDAVALASRLEGFSLLAGSGLELGMHISPAARDSEKQSSISSQCTERQSFDSRNFLCTVQGLDTMTADRLSSAHGDGTKVKALESLEHYCRMAKDIEDQVLQTITTLNKSERELKEKIRKITAVKTECDNLIHEYRAKATSWSAGVNSVSHSIYANLDAMPEVRNTIRGINLSSASLTTIPSEKFEEYSSNQISVVAEAFSEEHKYIADRNEFSNQMEDNNISSKIQVEPLVFSNHNAELYNHSNGLVEQIAGRRASNSNLHCHPKSHSSVHFTVAENNTSRADINFLGLPGQLVHTHDTLDNSLHHDPKQFEIENMDCSASLLQSLPFHHADHAELNPVQNEPVSLQTPHTCGNGLSIPVYPYLLKEDFNRREVFASKIAETIINTQIDERNSMETSTDANSMGASSDKLGLKQFSQMQHETHQGLKISDINEQLNVCAVDVDDDIAESSIRHYSLTEKNTNGTEFSANCKAGVNCYPVNGQLHKNRNPFSSLRTEIRKSSLLSGKSNTTVDCALSAANIVHQHPSSNLKRLSGGGLEKNLISNEKEKLSSELLNGNIQPEKYHSEQDSLDIDSDQTLGGLRHMGTSQILLMQNIYRSKIAMLDLEYSKRNAGNRSDQSVAGCASMKNSVHQSILSEDDRDESTPSDCTTLLPQISPSKFRSGKMAAKMAALPAVYLPALSRFQGKGIPRRAGGGFSSDVTEGPARYSTAPSSRLEFLSLQGSLLDF